jgi:hypothetical protein
MQDLENLRTALIITLSVLVLVLAFRRFKQYVLAKDMPAPLHAELLALGVLYHPARLRVDLSVPTRQTIHYALLDNAHAHVHSWEDQPAQDGRYTLELGLPELAEGRYYLEMRTATQRTLRQFRLQPA